MFNLAQSRRVRVAFRLAGVFALLATVSACGVGSLLGGGNSTGSTGSSLANTSASPDEISLAAQNALPAIATECPPIKVRQGGEALFSYANKRVGDPRGLQFQAVLDRQSRNCVVSNGLITVKMGVVGRVLLGPSGNINEVTVPLRFAVERDELAIYSQKYDIPVTLDGAEQTKDFIKVVENVAIPYIGGEDIIIWVGFDPS